MKNRFRNLLFFVLVLNGMLVPRLANAGDKHNQQQQQSSGITWAQQAMAALTGGNLVSSISESGTVTLGNGGGQATISLASTGVMTDQITITTNAGNRSEVRQWGGQRPSGQWTGLNGQNHPMNTFNCWTDAVWFFPALSLLSDYNDPNLVLSDLGQLQYNGGSVEHIQIYRYLPTLPEALQREIQQWSTVDYYLDSQTALPVAMAFHGHSDRNLNVDIPIAIVFGQYQTVAGMQVPFQVTELMNGNSILKVAVTSVVPNAQNLR
jgi:hypothetical protein